MHVVQRVVHGDGVVAEHGVVVILQPAVGPPLAQQHLLHHVEQAPERVLALRAAQRGAVAREQQPQAHLPEVPVRGVDGGAQRGDSSPAEERLERGGAARDEGVRKTTTAARMAR